MRVKIFVLTILLSCGSKAGPYYNLGSFWKNPSAPASKIDTWNSYTGLGDGAASPNIANGVSCWINSKVLIWSFGSGFLYDPATDRWTSMSTVGAPSGFSYSGGGCANGYLVLWGTDASWTTISGSSITIAGRYHVASDTWLSVSTTNQPTTRAGFSFTEAGSKIIIWGGRTATGDVKTGGVYDPAADTWVPTKTTGGNAAAPRMYHRAAWTGTHLLIWGGWSDTSYEHSGSLLDLASDTWTSSMSTVGSPTEVFSGVQTAQTFYLNGYLYYFRGYTPWFRYNVSTNTWSAMSAVGYDDFWESRGLQVVGNYLYVFGGCAGSGCNASSWTKTFQRYDTATDSWSNVTEVGAPSVRRSPILVDMGGKLFLWGGYTSSPNLTGGFYDPDADDWTTVYSTTEPAAYKIDANFLAYSLVVGSGTPYLFGGSISSSAGETKGRYFNFTTNSWRKMRTLNQPSARKNHYGVWTGSNMLIYGGENGTTPLNTGGLYNPATDSWTPLATTDAPPARLHAPPNRNYNYYSEETDRLVVYSSSPTLGNAGSILNLSTNTWTPIASFNAPSSRAHPLVFFGYGKMVVWGGCQADPCSFANTLSSGAILDLATNTWTLISETGSPYPGFLGSEVFTSGLQFYIHGTSNYSSLGVGRTDITGYSYNILTSTWTALTSPTYHDVLYKGINALWTGLKLQAWHPTYTHAFFEPSTSAWASVGTLPVNSSSPIELTNQKTYDGMYITCSNNCRFLTKPGLIYNPTSNTFKGMSTVGQPNSALSSSYWDGSKLYGLSTTILFVYTY